MKWENKIKHMYYQLYNVMAKTLKWSLFSIRHPDFKKELRKNKQFHNQYKGQRCFVIGNGPSLKSVDLSSLANEYTFTVNQISRNPHFKELKTNFHFITDTVFFQIDENNSEDLELMNTIKKINTENNRPTVFFPVLVMEFAKKHGLDKDFDLHFLAEGLYFLDNIKIDYSKYVPGFCTVVQFCITMAIYMGFSEIYLLGCDNTGLITTIQTMLDNQSNNYAYEISDNEQKRMKKVADSQNLYSCICGYANIQNGYTLLYSYCQKHGIKLINCTEKSAIDLIPHAKLEDILKNQ